MTIVTGMQASTQIVILSFMDCTEAGTAEIATQIDGLPKAGVDAEPPTQSSLDWQDYTESSSSSPSRTSLNVHPGETGSGETGTLQVMVTPILFESSGSGNPNSRTSRFTRRLRWLCFKIDAEITHDYRNWDAGFDPDFRPLHHGLHLPGPRGSMDH